MQHVSTTLLDLLGVALVVAATYLWGGVPAGLLTAGVSALLVSWSIERRGASRAPSGDRA